MSKAHTKTSSGKRRVTLSDQTRALYETQDNNLDNADPDAPILPPEMWNGAEIGKYYRPLKTAISVRVDNDVLEWLKSKGEGHLTRINEIVRERMMNERIQQGRRHRSRTDEPSRRQHIETTSLFMQTNIGSEEQWRELDRRHPGLFEAVNALIDIWGTVAETPVNLPTLAHEIVFALSRVCMEECWEVFLLAANQYITGAFKILRGLYERTLTLAYISRFPEKASRFRDYAAIQEHRILAHARKLFSDDLLNEVWKPGTIADLEANYQRLKPAFQRTKCKKCKTTELAHSWDIDLASMAEKTGQGFTDLYLAAYLSPTFEAHATLASAFSRIAKTDDGRVIFDYKRTAADVDLCLVHTFALIDIVLQATVEMFALPMDRELRKFQKASKRAWREQDNA